MKNVSSETTSTKTTINYYHHVSLNTEKEQSHGANATISSWWESGDARKPFAPCTIKYDINECVKEIVIERIELLESVHGNGKNWTEVVEPWTWNVDTCPYSESDVFTLQLKRMYLVSVLRQFVLNVTDNLTTQRTWKSCLLFGIEAMNDVGSEYYSNYRTLARWHRKLAKHQLYFCKTPEAKTRIPPFICNNHDAMDAFKRYGVANIQDQRVNSCATMCIRILFHSSCRKRSKMTCSMMTVTNAMLLLSEY